MPSPGSHGWDFEHEHEHERRNSQQLLAWLQAPLLPSFLQSF